MNTAAAVARVHQATFSITTRGRGTVEITAAVERIAAESGVIKGMCQVFLQHTSASLLLCENADPTVRRDLEAWIARAVPDGDALFAHQDEGPDDMPAHIRTILTKTDLTIPVAANGLLLGTWQGIYLWEHRIAPHRRDVVVTLWGV